MGQALLFTAHLSHLMLFREAVFMIYPFLLVSSQRLSYTNLLSIIIVIKTSALIFRASTVDDLMKRAKKQKANAEYVAVVLDTPGGNESLKVC